MRWSKIAALALVVSGPATPAELPRWVYSTMTDPMTGESIAIGSIQSVSTLLFGAPHDGSRRATLTISRHPHRGTSVMLSVKRGQFVCGHSCQVRVRFDDAPPFALVATGAADGSPTDLFVVMAGVFMDSLRVSQRVLIEATFYQEGARVIEFAPQGLVWEVTKEDRDQEEGDFLMARMGTFEYCQGRGSHESDCLNRSSECVHAYQDNGPAAGKLAASLRCFNAVRTRQEERVSDSPRMLVEPGE